MSNSFEKLENSMVKIRMEIEPAAFEAACERAYNKEKGRISLPGFRKGKAPRKMIEQAYGKEIFYEDAINDILPALYESAVAELGLDVMSRPAIDLEPIIAGAPVVVTADVAVRPEIKLPKYKAMKVAKEEAEVSAEDIEAELKKIANRNARMITVDRPAENGDTVNLDYAGSVDGVLFEGGSAEGQDLELGSGSFIPGFEDQLVGASAGDTVDVKVTFPTEYHAKDLAGKAAVFKCKVNAVKVNELPELNDDFAQDVSECDTLEAYKAQIAEDLKARKSADLNKKRTAAIFDKIIEKLECEIPAPITETRAEMMIEDMARNLQYQGLSIEQYMQYMGTDINGLKESIRPQALRAVQEELILSEIAKAEKLEVSEEDIEKEIADMAKMYSMEADKLKSLISEQEMAGMKEDLLKKKAEEFLAEAVKA